MAKTKSAKKAVRSSKNKRVNNLFWKKQIKESINELKKNLSNKDVDTAILNTGLVALQKVLDKASKENVIHKNKANRLKSAYAKKLSVPGQKPKKQAKSSK